jgi:cytochrome b
MVLSFAGTYLTAESDRWRLLHVTLGYTMAGLVLFRILWGFVGTRYARFSSFVQRPKSVMRYLYSLLRGRPEHYVGHNPAGAIVIVCMIGMSLIVTVAGWATYHEVGGEWLEELHEGAANAMLMLVGVHIAGVLVSGKLHHENLVRPMINGYKTGTVELGIRYAWRSVAAIMLVAVFTFWLLQWTGAPFAPGAYLAYLGKSLH